VSLQPLDKLPETPVQIKRSLLSVFDKTNIIPLAQALQAAGVELIATGGTAEILRKEAIAVTEISQVTGASEMLDGRVKTLHPSIHAGILARTSHQPDKDELKQHNIQPIELVVCNLYPFQEVIQQPDCTPSIAAENIDIGGPTMIRSAAKNFAHVCVLTNPGQYHDFISQIEAGNSINFEYRRQCARQAFNHTAKYEACVANYFNDMQNDGSVAQLNIALPKSRDLRYGENPHQQAAVYGNQQEWIDCFHGKALSYNNFLDIDAALRLIADFKGDKPTCAILKHTVPCGVAADENLITAWEKAFATDTSSPYGGVVAVNEELDLETAKAIDEIFTELILAPSFSPEAKKLLQQKKNRRLIHIKKLPLQNKSVDFRSIFGGALSQQSNTGSLDFDSVEIPTKRKPSEQEMKDLKFAWKVVKHVKSNAIVYARDNRTIGIGTGQPSRIDSSEIAINKARNEGLDLQNTVIASDAFFPFADGLQAAAEAGATAAIQPGGSIRDKEVIEEANRQHMAMVFTGRRHFRH
jgi:phosphoribosylaminoimidazolecarboxamide formyltransferase/IMP cyclohydrolase